MKSISCHLWLLAYRIESRRQHAADRAELLTEACCCVALALLRRFR